MNNLRITTVQTALHWEDASANLAMFSDLLSDLRGKTDLIILPEMFTSGFSMHASSMAESMDGNTMAWMKEQAASLKAVITGSLIIKEGADYYNRLIWMTPGGKYHYYDKRHLFTLAGEHKSYMPGQNRLITELMGWKICPLICYDLRFPVWSRNDLDFHLLIYVANWPETRRNHWQSLLTARAIENQCYVAGVNRTGRDGAGLAYAGDTSMIEFSGEVIYRSSATDAVFTCELKGEEMIAYRNKLNFLADRDKFQIFTD